MGNRVEKAALTPDVQQTSTPTRPSPVFPAYLHPIELIVPAIEVAINYTSQEKEVPHQLSAATSSDEDRLPDYSPLFISNAVCLGFSVFPASALQKFGYEEGTTYSRMMGGHAAVEDSNSSTFTPKALEHLFALGIALEPVVLYLFAMLCCKTPHKVTKFLDKKYFTYKKGKFLTLKPDAILKTSDLREDDPMNKMYKHSPASVLIEIKVLSQDLFRTSASDSKPKANPAERMRRMVSTLTLMKVLKEDGQVNYLHPWSLQGAAYALHDQNQKPHLGRLLVLGPEGLFDQPFQVGEPERAVISNYLSNLSSRLLLLNNEGTLTASDKSFKAALDEVLAATDHASKKSKTLVYNWEAQHLPQLLAASTEKRKAEAKDVVSFKKSLTGATFDCMSNLQKSAARSKIEKEDGNVDIVPYSTDLIYSMNSFHPEEKENLDKLVKAEDTMDDVVVLT